MSLLSTFVDGMWDSKSRIFQIGNSVEMLPLMGNFSTIRLKTGESVSCGVFMEGWGKVY
jgi:hypothetical protein